VLVGDCGGDVLLELAGAAFAEVDVEVVAVEVGRDGADEPAAVDVDDLGGVAVAQFVDADPVSAARGLLSRAAGVGGGGGQAQHAGWRGGALA